jgi:hypothetical protein
VGNTCNLHHALQLRGKGSISKPALYPQTDQRGEIIDSGAHLIEAIHNLCVWVSMEVEVSELVALTSIVFAVGASLAWSRFLHPKK